MNWLIVIGCVIVCGVIICGFLLLTDLESLNGEGDE